MLCIGTSWYAAVFIVVNTAIGTGFLNLPSAYYKGGGIGVGLTLQCVSLLLIYVVCQAVIYFNVMTACSHQNLAYRIPKICVDKTYKGKDKGYDEKIMFFDFC